MTDISLFKRALNEFTMSYKIIFTIIKNSIKFQKNDGIICWSPSIFFTPLIIYLKVLNNCKCYLILRDIFPKWAKDLKIIKNELIYQIFNLFSFYNVISLILLGFKSESNTKFIPRRIFFKKNKIEVLNNWYKPNFDSTRNEINLSKTILKNKKVFVHAGNIGFAQGFEILLNLAKEIQNNKEIGFLFVGRGYKFENMNNIAKQNGITNVLFHEEIDNSSIMNLYAQCSCGIVMLDKRHKTHNIPGKFLSYIHAGLPTFALVNPNNDLINIINHNNLGFATSIYDIKFLKEQIINLASSIDFRSNSNAGNRKVAKDLFSVRNAANQILIKFKR